MATRLLLTLLALLAGFATQFSTAQARASVSVETEIGAIAGEWVAQPRAASAKSLPAASGHGMQAREGAQLPAAIERAVPTVLQGIDRARE